MVNDLADLRAENFTRLGESPEAASLHRNPERERIGITSVGDSTDEVKTWHWGTQPPPFSQLRSENAGCQAYTPALPHIPNLRFLSGEID